MVVLLDGMVALWGSNSRQQIDGWGNAGGLGVGLQKLVALDVIFLGQYVLLGLGKHLFL